ncbi:hypothetical protein, partial [Erwinia sp. V71]|uniref:hypothetical protein n=1 Tax=Erwinia sp. V71 TaxID=3369424 RepID=UPI003F62DDB8
DSLSVANRPSIHMTKRCTYYLNSRRYKNINTISEAGYAGLNVITIKNKGQLTMAICFPLLFLIWSWRICPKVE